MPLSYKALDPEPFFFIYTTLPDDNTARQLAESLLEARYVACVNIIKGITSLYVDEGRVHTSSEAALLLKTTCDARNEALAFLEKNHPYTTPAILTWKAECNKPFGDWMSSLSLLHP